MGLAVRVDEGKFQDQPFLTFDTNAVEAFDPFVVDVDDDGILEQYRFERRPLYAEVRPRDGAAFRVLGLHLKSKDIFGAYEWSKWWKIADANRNPRHPWVTEAGVYLDIWDGQKIYRKYPFASDHFPVSAVVKV